VPAKKIPQLQQLRQQSRRLIRRQHAFQQPQTVYSKAPAGNNKVPRAVNPARRWASLEPVQSRSGDSSDSMALCPP